MKLSLQETDSDGTKTYILQGELTISSAQEFWAGLSSIRKEDRVVFDLQGIQKLDSSGVQALLFLKQEFQASGKSLKLQNHSPAVLKVWDILGLVSFFGDKIRLKKEDASSYSFQYGTKR